jgi:hypothetical protein
MDSFVSRFGSNDRVRFSQFREYRSQRVISEPA